MAAAAATLLSRRDSQRRRRPSQPGWYAELFPGELGEDWAAVEGFAGTRVGPATAAAAAVTPGPGKLENSSPPTLYSRRERHLIIKAQAAFRGHRTRKYARRILATKVHVSALAVKHMHAEIVQLHYGWRRFCIHGILFVLMCSAAWMQILRLEPHAHDVEGSLQKAIFDVRWGDNGDDFTGVGTTNDINDFVDAVVDSLYSPEPYDPPMPGCVASLEDKTCDNALHNTTFLESCTMPSERSGFLDSYNRYQFGLVIRQTRRVMGQCSGHSADLYTDFFDTYNEQHAQSECTGIGRAREYRSKYLTEHPETEFPANLGHEPFRYEPLVNGFYIVLDLGALNVGKQVQKCHWNYLREVGWLDSATSSVMVGLVVQNQNEAGRYGYFDVEFSISIGGRISATANIVSAQILSHSDLTSTIVVTLLYLAFTLLVAAMFVLKLLRRVGACGCKSKRGRWSRVRWAFESSVIVLHLVCISFFFKAYQDAQTFVAFADDDEREILNGLQRIKVMVAALYQLRVLFSILIILMVVRTIVLLDFHPDTAIISQTILGGGADLASFFLVYFVIIVSFAYAGLLLFGSDGDAFSSFSNSLSNLLFVSMGEFDSALSVIDNKNLTRDALTSQIFLWTYIFFTTLVLFNVLLSIVVESYIKFQERKRAKPSLSLILSLKVFLMHLKYDVMYYWLPQLGKWCGSQNFAPRTRHVSGSSMFCTLISGDPAGRQGTNLSFFQRDLNDMACAALERPHSLVQRLRFMSSYCQAQIPTFMARAEYQAIFSDCAAEKILSLLRQRTSILRVDPLEQELNMLFDHGESQLYAVQLIGQLSNSVQKLSDRIESILPVDPHQRVTRGSSSTMAESVDSAHCDARVGLSRSSATGYLSEQGMSGRLGEEEEQRAPTAQDETPLSTGPSQHASKTRNS